jgi:hypothetical protein
MPEKGGVVMGTFMSGVGVSRPVLHNAAMKITSVLMMLWYVGSATDVMANSTGPDHRGYDARVEADGSVKVCIFEYLYGGPANTSLTCKKSVLLRQNPSTGEVVKLPPFCASDDPFTGCFRDECLPEGYYRYGLATPFDCKGTSHDVSADYYVEVDSPGPPVGCVRSATNPGPSPYPEGVPWQNTVQVCMATGCGCSLYRAESGQKTPALLAILAAAGVILLRRRVKR